MVGYWNQSKQTFNIDSSRWFDTGDVGWIDSHGNLWLVGRTKYQIKSGGENIHPEEVEAVLCQHPGLAAAVVIGIPDHRLYEKVVACVSINQKWNWVTDKSCSSVEVNKLSAEILQEHCRQKRLTGFKIPKVYIPWKKPFPLCSSGKLRREDFKREVMSYFRNPRSSL
ncbi:hypothetical protein HPP92_000819 [Vanilla planifolia]|uniref:AMP-binding enzyme C-terminal domain-containing protein n=1 Tax=Vanilla planifolia TaxID=51239 RepID=A0A835SBV7_VANPL|nr:hypothetical protein HPP92_000819 [Vanilla planifolia]